MTDAEFVAWMRSRCDLDPESMSAFRGETGREVLILCDIAEQALKPSCQHVWIFKDEVSTKTYCIKCGFSNMKPE